MESMEKKDFDDGEAWTDETFELLCKMVYSAYTKSSFYNYYHYEPHEIELKPVEVRDQWGYLSQRYLVQDENLKDLQIELRYLLLICISFPAPQNKCDAESHSLLGLHSSCHCPLDPASHCTTSVIDLMDLPTHMHVSLKVLMGARLPCAM